METVIADKGFEEEKGKENWEGGELYGIGKQGNDRMTCMRAVCRMCGEFEFGVWQSLNLVCLFPGIQL